MKEKTMEKDSGIKCASMIGELSDLGKHVYLSDIGVTLCGCFTVDYDKEKFKNMPDGLVSEYKIEHWEITCTRCLEMIGIFEKINEVKKTKDS